MESLESLRELSVFKLIKISPYQSMVAAYPGERLEASVCKQVTARHFQRPGEHKIQTWYGFKFWTP